MAPPAPAARPPAPAVILRGALVPGAEADWLAFGSPRRIVQAHRPEDVGAVFAAVDAALAAGDWAAGFVAYEAAPAFDGALDVHPPGELPLAWFALCGAPRPWNPGNPEAACERTAWRPSIDAAAHARAVAAVRRAIERGETYQVNFTWRLVAAGLADPWPRFRLEAARRPADGMAWVDTGADVFCSLSPEIFFRLADGRIEMKPMKGTAARGLTAEEDRRRALELWNSPKERAENLMIVDMVRNDLGRVACPGSVTVGSLFDLEKYDTVHQLTSTVVARTAASPRQIFAALFPSASVTGAPKASSMRWIRELETSPRGVYTGAIGCFGPGGRGGFNVAIRTLHHERQRQRGAYGIGGGIVWDSDARREHREGLDKARVLEPPPPPFALLETLAWRPGEGYALLDRHLERLAGSADYFDFPYSRDSVLAALAHAALPLDTPTRVRLTLAANGTIEIASLPLDVGPAVWSVTLANEPVDPDERFLYHKTTRRDLYRRARAAVPPADEVLLWNPERRLTEATRFNVAVLVGGRWLTPPVAEGLLPGTLRAELLACGRLREAPIALADLAAAGGLALLNSVRGWLPARLLAAPPVAVSETRRPPLRTS